MNDDGPLIGHAPEREMLSALLDRSASGRGEVALIGGEAGIGKTRLVQAVTGACGMAVHAARATGGPGTPYQLPVELLRTHSSRNLASGLQALLAGKPLPDDQAAALPGQIVEALCELAAPGAALILLEDLNEADAATLELLPQLATRLESLPLAALLTYRSDEVGRDHPLRRMNARLRRLPNVREVQLKPLTLRETGLLAKQVLGGPPAPKLRAELHRRTSGLPLCVEELCRVLAEGYLMADEEGRLSLTTDRGMPIPETIRDTLLQRFEVLSDHARAAVETAAVAGAEFDLDLLVALGAEEAGIDELLAGGLLVEQRGGRGGFRHALLQEAVLDEIPWSRRRRLNAALAPLLARRGAPKRVVAHHYQLAGRHEEARQAFLEHARASCHLHAYRDAAEAFKGALELWPEGENEDERLACLERLAQCAQVSGHLAESARTWREVVESELLRRDPERRARAWRSLASVYDLQASTQPALAARRSAFEAFQEAGADEEAAVEALGIAEADLILLQLDRGVAEAETALALARAARCHEAEANALSLIGLGLAMQGHAVEARRKIEAGLELALRHNAKQAAAAAYQRMPYVHGYRADYRGQREAFGAALEFCDREALETKRSACLGCMAYAMFRNGDWKRSGEIARGLLKSGPPGGEFDAGAGLVLGMLAVMRGELKSARKYLSESDAAARRLGLAPAELVTRSGLAMCDELAGDDADAARRYRDLRQFWETTQDQLDVLIGLCRAATFFAGHREREELAACAEAARRIASGDAHPEALGSLAFVLGEVSLLEGQPDESAAHFQRAREQFERCDLKPDTMRCDWRIGVALQRSGQADRAVETLRRSYREARGLGARPLMSIVAGTLEAMGKPVTEEHDAKAPARSARAGLTQRQREVAALIGNGLTNKEIASELGLSTRTIDMHVGNVLDRLNCRSRSEAVRKLVDLGILE